MLYIGVIRWNRQRRLKDPNTGLRVMRRIRESAWVRKDVPELRIISDDLWASAKARQIELYLQEQHRRLTPSLGAQGGRERSQLNPPSGCPFNPRCPLVMERCRVEVPPLERKGGQLVACWAVA